MQGRRPRSEGDATTPARTWHRLLRLYHQPAAVGLVLLALLVAWNLQERERSRDLGLREVRESARSVSDTLAASLQALVRRGVLDLERVRIVLENVVATTDVAYLALAVDQKVVVVAGEPPRGLAPTGPQGERLLADEFALWNAVRLQDSPLPYRHRYPDFELAANDSTLLDVAAGSQSLVLAMSARAYEEHVAEAIARLDVILVVGTLCIAGLWAAWTVSVRNRELSGRLQAARLRAEHLGELELTARGLAHETRNPLGLVRGLAQRIAGDPLVPGTARDDAAAIMEQADTAAARLGDFLAYARPRPPRLRPVALLGLVRRVCGLLAADFAAAGVALTCRGDDVGCLADPEQAEQILVNLLLNSLQASAAGTEVTVRIERVGDRLVRLEVRDQGEGVAPELRTDLFKPYVTGRSDGHGLGLAIVKRMVEDHGWSIGVQSPSPADGDGGTSMTIDGITMLGRQHDPEATA
ncbi:MAG: ATP-binding protein [Candidatus Krumholzibacteriia bacterium]